MDRLALLKKIGSSRKWTEQRYQRGRLAQKATDRAEQVKVAKRRSWAKRVAIMKHLKARTRDEG